MKNSYLDGLVEVIKTFDQANDKTKKDLLMLMINEIIDLNTGAIYYESIMDKLCPNWKEQMSVLEYMALLDKEKEKLCEKLNEEEVCN